MRAPAILIALALWMVGAPAFAQSCITWEIQSMETGLFQGGFPTVAAACAWSRPANDGTYSYTVQSANETSGACVIRRNDGGLLNGQASPSSGPCACSPGSGRTVNFTVGWGRSANADADDLIAPAAEPPSPDSVDDGTCVGSMHIPGIECYRSQVPSAQGLYRVSCDYPIVVTGTSPTGVVPDEFNPSLPPATCPGFVGQINGKEVCVGTSSSPLPPAAAAPNLPTAAGNPSAGPKPSTGAGSGDTGAGRTPSTGTGGNDGGPAAAAVGAGGTGDRDDGSPEPSSAVCGAPPLPACNVKVDEAGTPAQNTSASRFTPATTALNQQTTALQTELNRARDLSPSGWTWSFSFPTGCTPLVLAAFNDLEIDVCQWQPMIHDLMSMIWAIAGFFGFINLYRTSQGN